MNRWCVFPLPPLRSGAQGIESVDTESDLQAVMRERQTQAFRSYGADSPRCVLC